MNYSINRIQKIFLAKKIFLVRDCSVGCGIFSSSCLFSGTIIAHHSILLSRSATDLRTENLFSKIRYLISYDNSTVVRYYMLKNNWKNENSRPEKIKSFIGPTKIGPQSKTHMQGQNEHNKKL